ncbi:MAG: DUF962 domain-containing protein [Candidatus Acidiferrales bacterium]
MQPPRSFGESWPQYVLAHRHPATCAFHFTDTGRLGAARRGNPVAQPVAGAAALLLPYALAWFSHFFVEHNRPATFGHPLWSWLADQKMVALMLVGKMANEVRRVTNVSLDGRECKE